MEIKRRSFHSMIYRIQDKIEEMDIPQEEILQGLILALQVAYEEDISERDKQMQEAFKAGQQVGITSVLDYIGSMNMFDEISNEAYKKIVVHFGD